VLRIFIALKNTSLWSGFEPRTFGSGGQHTNHYTTEEAQHTVTVLSPGANKVIRGSVSTSYLEKTGRT
jgi:hypothetical protein